MYHKSSSSSYNKNMLTFLATYLNLKNKISINKSQFVSKCVKTNFILIIILQEIGSNECVATRGLNGPAIMTLV